MLAVDGDFERIRRIAAGVQEVVGGGRSGDNNLHGEVAVAGHCGREDFAGTSFVVLADHVTEGIVALEFGMNLNLLGLHGGTVQAQEKAETELPDHLM